MAAETICDSPPCETPQPIKPKHGRLALTLRVGQSAYIFHADELIRVESMGGNRIACIASERFALSQEGRAEIHRFEIEVGQYDLDHAVITDRVSGQTLRIGRCRKRFFFKGHGDYKIQRGAARRSDSHAALCVKPLEAQ